MSQQEPEAVVVYKVRDLLDAFRDDLNRRFDELSTKLDDRVTVGVFRALRSDLDAALKRIGDLEDAADQRTARTQGVNAVIGFVLRFGGWLVATGLGIAWLLLTATSHG